MIQVMAYWTKSLREPRFTKVNSQKPVIIWFISSKLMSLSIIINVNTEIIKDYLEIETYDNILTIVFHGFLWSNMPTVHTL